MVSQALSVEVVALELLSAERDRATLDALTDRFPDITTRQAYDIQLSAVKKRLESGRRIVGKKIGLTSVAMQQMLGVGEADYGHLFDDMVVGNGQPIPTSRLIQPKCEGEIAFLLKKDLLGPGVTVAQVLDATEGVIPALEIVDSRVRDWKIKIQDTVADNASSGLVVLGDKLTPVPGLDLRLIGMVLEKNGAVIGTGAGAAVLGHPAASVAWLANKLHEFEVVLRAGELILSGALTAAPPVVAGDFFRADFDRLGSVSARFI